MAHAQSNSKNDKAIASNVSGGGENEVKPTTFHDFLGNKGQGQESGTSDLGTAQQHFTSPENQIISPTVGEERHVSHHLEGIPFYVSRGDITGPEISNRITGNKRSNAESFMLSSRDKFPKGQADSQDNPFVTKMLQYSVGEQPRQLVDEEASFAMHQMWAIPSSIVSQSSAGGRIDTNTSKRERDVPMNFGPTYQYPPRAGQVMPFGYQASSNRFKEANVGPSVVSQTAADEGSRTGIKGSGILSSMNATGTIGRQPSGVLIRNKQKSGISIAEPEFSTAPSQRGTESGGRQMTIFYGGQAHVFDNVHPNKADVIMALAGSNGGSWSTNYTPNSGAKPSNGENFITSGENDAGIAILRELQGIRPSDKGDSLRAFDTAGGFQGVIGSKEKTGSVQAAKISAGRKGEDEYLT